MKRLLILMASVLTILLESRGQSSTNNAILNANEQFLLTRIQQVEAKTSADITALNHQLENSYKFFSNFGLFAGSLLTFLTIWNFIRDQRHHKDYQKERAFYEERAN